MAGNNLIQLLRCTSDVRRNSTSIALDGQPVYETDTHYLFVGDGHTQAKDLIAVNANRADNASTANSANADENGNNIVSTYVKSISTAGTTLTYTFGNNTTKSITTQDTTYSVGAGLQIDDDNVISVNTGYTEGGRFYAVKTDQKSGKLYVNVPWVSYESGNGITVSGSTISLSTPISVENGGTGATTLTGAGIVTTTDSQVVGGAKTFTGDNIVKGDFSINTDETRYKFFDFRDTNNARIGVVGSTARNDGKYGTYLQAGDEGSITILSDGTNAQAEVSCDVTIHGQLDFESLSTRAANALLSMVKVNVATEQTQQTITVGGSLSDWTPFESPTMFGLYYIDGVSISTNGAYPLNITVTGGTAQVGGSGDNVGWSARDIVYDDVANTVTFRAAIDRSLFATDQEVTNWLSQNSVTYTITYTPITTEIRK